MTVTASALRADVYNILDRAIASGEVVEIERNGVVVRLVPPPKRSRLERLPRRSVIVGDGDLAEFSPAQWAPELP